MNNTMHYIDNQAALQNLCRQLDQASWLALDTEFLREKTYYPKLCLLQLATPDIQACIDPLAIDDLSPLLELLYRPGITKVFHAARQDLEIFHQLRGEVPSPIFDTQIAAPLLGHAEQIGYGNLVTAELGIKLDKDHARADWSRRPLPQAQLKYAMDDVIYLAQLYPKMIRQLQEKNRLDWLNEDFAQLERAECYQNIPEDAWRRIRNSNRLKPQQLAVLQALAAWREQTAQQENRPRNWLCRDDALIDMARLRPHNREELAHIRGLQDKFLSRHGDTLLQLIEKAQAAPPPKLEPINQHDKPKPEQQAVVDALMAVINLRAAQQSLNPNIFASRKTVEKLVNGEPDSPLLHGWRKPLIGDELQAVLGGQRELYIDDRRLHIRICKTPEAAG